ncbi:MAG: helix-turn-helix transcriptional regulator [Oscillospiraceae bacterium]
MLVRKMRVLRLKHNISTAQLAAAIQVSQQWISAIELSDTPRSPQTAELVCRAFETLLVARKSELLELEQDYLYHCDSLLDLVEECRYEL